MLMNKKLKRKIVSLAQRMLRIPRTRGFGVQSPTAYSILRNVINEHGFLKNVSLINSKSCSYPFYASRQERLIFRIRYYYHDTVLSSAMSLLSTEVYESFFANFADSSVLIIHDLDGSEEAKDVWRRILADKRAILTYDLLNCGVVFFDKTKIKQNFKVNY